MVYCGLRGCKATPDFLVCYEVDLRAALEAAGVIFVEENGEGPGVRLRKANSDDRKSGSR
jgi:hypothetical protein